MFRKLMLLGLCMFLLVGLVGAELCYQESANSTSDCSGTCTCYDTGEYFIFNPASAASRMFDGNWSSKSCADYFYINYTKPDSSNGAIWETKIGYKLGEQDGTYHNTTIPLNCWDTFIDKISLKLSCYGAGAGETLGWCQNETGWVKIVHDYEEKTIYEEAMWWNITAEAPPPTPPQLNITSISKTSKLTINQGGMLTISK